MNSLCTFHTYPYHGYGTQLYRYFKRQTEEITLDITWTGLKGLTSNEKLNLF